MKVTRSTSFSMILSSAILVALALMLGGCKAQQQMQTQLADMDQRVQNSERKVTALETDLKKTTTELATLKSLVTKLGNTVVDLQKIEDERQRHVQEAKVKADSSKAKGAKKAAPAKGKKKK